MKVAATEKPAAMRAEAAAKAWEAEAKAGDEAWG